MWYCAAHAALSTECYFGRAITSAALMTWKFNATGGSAVSVLFQQCTQDLIRSLRPLPRLFESLGTDSGCVSRSTQRGYRRHLCTLPATLSGFDSLASAPPRLLGFPGTFSKRNGQLREQARSLLSIFFSSSGSSGITGAWAFPPSEGISGIAFPSVLSVSCAELCVYVRKPSASGPDPWKHLAS
jgi:hypothetical protein